MSDVYDNTTLISGSYDGNIKFWDINTGVLIKTLKNNTGEILCLSLFTNLDKNYLVSGTLLGFINFWDLNNDVVTEIHLEYSVSSLQILQSSKIVHRN